MIIHPTKTIAARNAIFTAQNSGLHLDLTHMALGDTGGAIDDARTTLRNERERVPLFGERVSIDAIALAAMFDGPATFDVRELGIFSNSLLVYYWSTTAADLGRKTAGFEWLFRDTLTLDDADQAVLNIAVQAQVLNLTVLPQLLSFGKAIIDTQLLVLKNHYL